MSNQSSSPSAVIPFYFQAIGSLQSHQVRALSIDGEPWFVARDVCDVLGYQNPSQTISDHLDDDERSIISIGRQGETNIISESGLYTLVIRSNKPQARVFRKWVTAEVLPAIRKTGAYIHPAWPPAIAIPLIPETLALKPGMRQRLWSDAMQAARLDGQGAAEAVAWFAELCRMMTARPSLPSGADGALRFIDECLEEARGWHTPFRDILAAFERWWAAGGMGQMPGSKTLALTVGSRFQRSKANIMVYRHCRLRPEALDALSKEASHA